MRIYENAYELMSEMGRNIWEMGIINSPKRYQNKNIEGNPDFITKELICEQYALLSLPDSEMLFKYSNSKEWAEAEFNERVTIDEKTGEPHNPGKAWELRKDLWEQFLNHLGIFDYTYSERIMCPVFYGTQETTKLGSIIKLLKEDPDTRKAVLNIYGDLEDKNSLDGVRRIPCSMYYDFLIRENVNGGKQLNITYHQRSSDFITHFGNDVYLAWKLMLYVSNAVGVKPGYLYHTIDSIHVYKKDWDTLKTSLGTSR